MFFFVCLFCLSLLPACWPDMAHLFCICNFYFICSIARLVMLLFDQHYVAALQASVRHAHQEELGNTQMISSQPCRVPVVVGAPTPE